MYILLLTAGGKKLITDVTLSRRKCPPPGPAVSLPIASRRRRLHIGIRSVSMYAYNIHVVNYTLIY